jgi:hypothetical protein
LIYSAAVFDLDAGPVTITLPVAGNRFMSMQVINEDECSLPAISTRPASTRSPGVSRQWGDHAALANRSFWLACG